MQVLTNVIDFVEHIAALNMLPGGDNPTQFPQYTDQNITLDVGVDLSSRSYFLWTDRTDFVPPTTPLLLSNQTCGVDPKTHIVNVPQGHIVDIIVNNLGKAHSVILYSGLSIFYYLLLSIIIYNLFIIYYLYLSIIICILCILLILFTIVYFC